MGGHIPVEEDATGVDNPFQLDRLEESAAKDSGGAATARSTGG